MQFSRVIGKLDPKLVKQAEEKLSTIFLELGTRYNNEHVGTGMGGDPLIFSLMYPVEHIATANLPTAATDGKRYYWNPKFVLKQSKIGLRIICGHEAWHAIYMHPQRRGSRLPKLWNIAVDYIVNGTVMDDFKARKMDPKEMFTKHLGKYMPLEDYANLLRDPFNPPAGYEGLTDKSDSDVKLPKPDEDRDLTPEEIAEIEKREKRAHFFYADPDLSEDMKKPEKIYDYLYNLLPKCPQCGSIGIYKKPDPNKKNKKQNKKDKKDQKDQSGDEKDQKDKGNNPSDQQDGGDQQDDKHNHGDGQQCDCPHGDQGDQGDQSGQGNQSGDQSGQGCGHGCGECGAGGDGLDIFGLGGTVDDHMDTSESEEKLAKRVADAMHAARKMAGHVPASLEDELGKLTAPKVTWQDVIRTRLLKARQGNGRNDWTRFKSRPMFAGVMTPKRRSYFATFGCLLDTSGSMSSDDMAYGLSQLISLDEKAEGTVVPADATLYWEDATKLRKANVEEISKVKVVGRGGTKFAEFFRDYKANIGECDFLIVITDGYLLDSDVAEMVNPGVDVFWVITSASSFNAPFGRVFELRE